MTDVCTETLHERISRFEEFFSRDQAGDVLFVCNYCPPGLAIDGLETGLDLGRFADSPEAFGRDKVRECRARFAARLAIGDHSVPFVNIGVGIGVMTAVFSGAEVTFQSGTSWSGSTLNSLEDLSSLSLDAGREWLDRVIAANRAALDMYEADFCMTPMVFRSPLDLAWGIRGDALLFELHERPTDVHSLLRWCVAAITDVDRRLRADVSVPPGRCGMWRAWLPDATIVLNGDPVDMMSPEFAREFDRPYAQQVMADAGGGFYHHHTLGRHQIAYAAGLDGVTVHNLVSDSPDLMRDLTTDPALRETVLAASMKSPIHWKCFDGREILDSLDVLAHGRFIIDLSLSDDLDLCKTIARRVSKLSNLD